GRDPPPPERGVLGLRQDDGILDRHARLVVVPVQHPLLELQLSELPVVHQHVIAVMIVVAVLALPPHPLDELVAAERRSRAFGGHIRTSLPSPPPSQPAPSPSAPSAAAPPAGR